eukprot:gnl/Chilomastix_caulleri/5852.p1 GENE.gnl/Chilomastix_caulleri/5852~~gnl/Chilomastix_caulleri/5852.p1  ORF type:complete len:107 (+),score=43.86 gnl/Chilomastix_caulleri/5852:106-426(+)
MNETTAFSFSLTVAMPVKTPVITGPQTVVIDAAAPYEVADITTDGITITDSVTTDKIECTYNDGTCTASTIAGIDSVDASKEGVFTINITSSGDVGFEVEITAKNS